MLTASPLEPMQRQPQGMAARVWLSRGPYRRPTPRRANRQRLSSPLTLNESQTPTNGCRQMTMMKRNQNARKRK